MSRAPERPFFVKKSEMFGILPKTANFLTQARRMVV